MIRNMKNLDEIPINEPVLEYKSKSKEKIELKRKIEELKNKEIDIPMFIGSKKIRTDKKIRISPPHDHNHTLAAKV